MCAEAMQQAIARCAAMGGTLESTDPALCIANCHCLLAAIPNFGACLMGPECPGCDAMEAVVERCGQAKILCRVPQEG